MRSYGESQQQQEPPNIFTSRTSTTHINGMSPPVGERKRLGASAAQNSGGYTPSITQKQQSTEQAPFQRFATQSSSIMNMTADDVAIADQTRSPEVLVGNDEYF